MGARALFHLLDVEETGEIDAELIVASCMRLHGHAKAIELAAFMHEYRRSQKAWMAHADHIEKTLGRICKAVNAQPHHQRAAASPTAHQRRGLVGHPHSDEPGGHGETHTHSHH